MTSIAKPSISYGLDIAIVGLGRAGNWYVNALSGVVDSIYCFDINRTNEALDSHTEIGNIRNVETWDELIQAMSSTGGRRVLILALPPSQLAKYSTPPHCFDSIIVEKPAALFHAHTRAEQELVYVGYQNMFAPGIESLLSAADSDDGTISIRIRIENQRPPEYFTGWRSELVESGGLLGQIAVHSLALALKIVGEEPFENARVQSEFVQRDARIPFYDQVSAKIEGQTFSIDLLASQGIRNSASSSYDTHSVEVDLGNECWTVDGKNLERGARLLSQRPSNVDYQIAQHLFRQRLVRATLDAADSRLVSISEGEVIVNCVNKILVRLPE